MNVIKLMLAMVLLRYDIKVEGNVRPKDRSFQGQIIPDLGAKIQFRREKQE